MNSSSLCIKSARAANGNVQFAAWGIRNIDERAIRYRLSSDAYWTPKVRAYKNESDSAKTAKTKWTGMGDLDDLDCDLLMK